MPTKRAFRLLQMSLKGNRSTHPSGEMGDTRSAFSTFIVCSPDRSLPPITLPTWSSTAFSRAPSAIFIIEPNIGRNELFCLPAGTRKFDQAYSVNGYYSGGSVSFCDRMWSRRRSALQCVVELLAGQPFGPPPKTFYPQRQWTFLVFSWLGEWHAASLQRLCDLGRINTLDISHLPGELATGSSV